MKRLLTAMTVLCVVCIGVPCAAGAEECRYHNFKFDLDDTEFPTVPGWDYCELHPKIQGTLKGDFLSCLNFADLKFSHEIWGDGNFDYAVSKWYDVIETKDGEIFFDERSTIKFGESGEFIALIGFVEVKGGTGAFEGATGVLKGSQKFPNRLDLLVIQGFICTP